MLSNQTSRWQIGPYTLDTNLQALLRGRETLAVGRRAAALLQVFVERAGEVVTKDELIAAAWGGLAVEESNLPVQVAALRRLFAADAVGEAWIETLPRRGYRFNGPAVAERPSTAPSAALPAGPMPPATDGEGSPSLAVLPFRTPEPDAVPHYLADGLAEELVTSLSGLAGLTVISSGTTARLRGRDESLSQLGRELGVRYVATGSMRQVAGRNRVLVELADVQTSAILTSRAYEMDRTSQFDAHDRIVRQIVQAIAPRLREEELRRSRRKRPENLQAYDLVLQAREQIYRLDPDAFDTAVPLLTRAIALDPDYAVAYTLMAEFFSLRFGQGWSKDPQSDGEAIGRFARAAIDRDPQDAYALAFLAHNSVFVRHDFDTALPLFERALDVAPSHAAAWMWSSVTHAYLCDGAEAVRRAVLALRLSPRDWFGFQFQTALCLAHYTAADYPAAISAGVGGGGPGVGGGPQPARARSGSARRPATHCPSISRSRTPRPLRRPPTDSGRSRIGLQHR
jgi:TolB-like protein